MRRRLQASASETLAPFCVRQAGSAGLSVCVKAASRFLHNPEVMMHIPTRPLLIPRSAFAPALSLRAALVGLAALVCGACGGNNDTGRETGVTADAATLAACDLLTADEIAQVLEAPVGAPHEQVISPPAPNRAGIAECTYVATDDSGQFVSVFLRRSAARDNDPATVRETVTSSGSTVTDVPDLGDAAFWDGAKLHVFSGGHTYFTIGVAGETALENAKSLARIALTRVVAPPSATQSQ